MVDQESDEGFACPEEHCLGVRRLAAAFPLAPSKIPPATDE